MNEIKNHGKKWLYWFSLGVCIIVIYKLLDNFSGIMGVVSTFFGILAPFFVGIFIAYLVYIPCKKIEEGLKKCKLKFISKKARALSIFAVYLIIVLLLTILVNFILPVVIESIVDLINNIPAYYEKLIKGYNNLPEDSPFKGEVVNEIIQNIQKIDIKKYFELDKIIGYIANAISAVSSIFNVFVAIIVSVYILSGRDRILKFLKRLAEAMFKEKTYKNIDKYFNNSNEIFFKFIASQFLDAVIVGVLVTIALTIMKVKYAPLLGFFIGLFNMIPYIGAIIAVGISVIITAITGGISQAIWMLIVTVILQQIDANIINPKIVGQSLKISPLLVIFAVTIGGAYFGMLGMFLAVPVIAVIKIVVEDYVDVKIEIKNKRKKKEMIESK